MSRKQGRPIIPELSIIIPTYNEKENIVELVRRLDAVLSKIDWEAIFVDDNSPDGTADLVRNVSENDGRISCLSRLDRRGLSSACIEGMSLARAPIIAIMDADLQHDESLLPEMYHEFENSDRDIVVGSRYMDGGGTGEWGALRLLISRAATRMSRMFVPKGLTDPMSGFFMMRREVYLETNARLYGKGFKILLDIFASSERDLSFKEFPYTFRTRNAGESKLSGNVIWDYLEFLLAKKLAPLIPSGFLLFALVGAVGVVVHMAVLWASHRVFMIPFGFAQTIAIGVAMTSNFFMNNAITYRHTPLKGSRIIAGLLSFYGSCAIGAVLNLSLAVFLETNSINWLLSGISGGIAGAVWNFTTTKYITWRKS